MMHLLAQAAAETPKGFWEGDFASLLGVWVAVGFTLALYTFLYKDNAIFKFAEHIYVGVTNGYLLWQAWINCVKPQLVFPIGRLIGHTFSPSTRAIQPDDTWWLLVPAALSLFMLLRFHPKTAWLSRWSFAFIVGTTAGTIVPLYVKAQIFQQMSKMLESPFVREGGSFSIMGTFSALLLAGVISVLTYFIFSVEHKGPIKVTARIGIIFLMIAFGAHFGYTVMGRESLLIGRAQFLIESSRNKSIDGGIDPYCATPVLFVLIVAAVATLEMVAASKAKEAPPASGSTPAPKPE